MVKELYQEENKLLIKIDEIAKASEQIKLTIDNKVLYEGAIYDYDYINVNNINDYSIVKLYVKAYGCWAYLDKIVIKHESVENEISLEDKMIMSKYLNELKDIMKSKLK